MANHRLELSLLLLCLALTSGGVIWLRTVNVQTTYDFSKLDRELKQVKNDLQLARVKWVKQTSPKHLESLAVPLGLSAPRLNQNLKYPAVSMAETDKRK